ncbi:MAG: hypothetical protein NT085_04130 [candidate division SR1 bacterium]|nr:hypothetical protein [candidate division SR1 bacterium]
MFKKIFTKISFFGALLFGFCMFSGCTQPTVGPSLKQTPPTSFSQPKQMRAQVQVRTRAS